MSYERCILVVDRFVRSPYTQDVRAQRIFDYLRTLREGRFTQDEVGKAIGYSGKQIGRWERASNDATLDGVIAYLQHVDGSWHDIAELMSVPDADPVALARVRRQQISVNSDHAQYNPLAGLTDDEVIALADRWNENDKARFREELLDFGRRAARMITGQRRERPDEEPRAPRP
jgi:transcriptional regulator with XRE-family HTH domain